MVQAPLAILGNHDEGKRRLRLGRADDGARVHPFTLQRLGHDIAEVVGAQLAEHRDIHPEPRCIHTGVVRAAAGMDLQRVEIGGGAFFREGVDRLAEDIQHQDAQAGQVEGGRRGWRSRLSIHDITPPPFTFKACPVM